MRAQAALEATAWVIATGQSDEAAVFEMDFGMLARLVNAFHPDAFVA